MLMSALLEHLKIVLFASDHNILKLLLTLILAYLVDIKCSNKK